MWGVVVLNLACQRACCFFCCYTGTGTGTWGVLFLYRTPTYNMVHMSFVAAHICLYVGIIALLARNSYYAEIWVDAVEYLEGAAVPLHIFNMTILISFLDFCGSVLACFGYRSVVTSLKRPISWLESLVACTLLQFGGTTLTGILLGQTPSWVLSHSAFPALLLAWWLTFYSPFDIFWNFFNSNQLFIFVMGAFASISAGHAVTSWGMDKALFNAAHVNHKRISESVLACIFCGTLSACGGGLLNDWFSFSRAPSFQSRTSPAIFSINNYAASATITRAFICACIYYAALNPCGYLPWDTFFISKEQGHLLVCTLQLVHFLSKQLVPDLDIYQIIAHLGLAVCMVNPVIALESEEKDE